MHNKEEIIKKLLQSDSLRSLLVESKVFRLLANLGWETEHSPFFIDSNTNKLRELDVKARKYFSKEKYSCDIDILVECKSLTNYHIVANNFTHEESDFDAIWTGAYTFGAFNKLDKLLVKHGLNPEESIYIKEKLENYCAPDVVWRWRDYFPKPFEIPTFHTYRETNINTTKEIDNSVIWKCIQSLQSAINAHEDLLMARIEGAILDGINSNKSRLRQIENIVDGLVGNSNHIYYIHPVIVVDAHLWELDAVEKITELKFFRLNIQRFFEHSFWVDIVNFNNLEEYLEKTNSYISFHKKKKFQIFL